MSVSVSIAQAGGSGQWMQYIGILLVIAFSALSWVLQKLSEQAAKKKKQDELERRKLEVLRTGRSEQQQQVQPVATPAQQRRDALAEKRRAQLEELRRRQRERAGGGAPQPMPVQTRTTMNPPTGPQAPSNPPIVFIPGSSGPIVVGPRRPGQQQPPARRTAQQRQGPQRQGQGRQGRQQQQQQQPGGRGRQARVEQRVIAPPAPVAKEPEVEQTHRLLTDSDVPGLRPISAGPEAAMKATEVIVPKTPEQWRQALVLREILAPPLSVRGPSGDLIP